MADIKVQLNYLRISPRKVRLVAGVIQGMSVPLAELELRYMVKNAAHPLLKLLRSAVAGAKHNHQLSRDDLVVSSVTVNEGPMLKRSRARAFGRAAMIRKRTSHVSLILSKKQSGSSKKLKAKS